MKHAIFTVTSVTVFAALMTCAAFGAKPVKTTNRKIEISLPAGTKIIDVGAKASVKTIEDALAQVRQIREEDTETPLAIRVAPGDYTPSKELRITHRHANTNTPPLFIYAADFANKPRVYGGDPITGWKKVEFNGRKDVWVADVSHLDVPTDRKLLRLAFNGRRMQAARYPNFNPDRPYTSGYGFAVRDKSEFYSNEIKRRPNDVHQWAHPEDGVAVTCGGDAAFGFNHDSIVSVSGNIVCTDRKRKAIKHGRPDRWCVYNLAEELDVAGEWYHDPRAKKVYFLTPDGSDPNRAHVTLDRQHAIFRVANGGSNCTIAGFELLCGRDGISINANDVQVLGCSIHDVGGIGIYGGVGVWIAGTHIQVRDCDIYHTGALGMMVHSHGNDRFFDFRQNVVVDNNYFHHCGELSPDDGAIFNCGQGVTISHNLMHDMPRTAISGYGRFCDISYNRIRHTNMMSSDGGALYDSGWNQGCGSKIRYNWISDAIGLRGFKDGFYVHRTNACGIYFDECTGGTEVYGNFVQGCHWAAVMMHNARWITVSNNVFISNGWVPVWHYTHQIEISTWNKEGFQSPFRRRTYMDAWKSLVKNDKRWREMPSLAQDPYTDEVYSNDGTMIMGNKFVNNIISYPDQSAGVLLYGFVNMSTNLFDRNIYWTGKSRVVRSSSRVYSNDDASWEGWRKKGQDLHSRIVNPNFRDPKRGDYRLKPGAPAFKLGFKDLPYDEMGLRVTKFRPVLPKEAEGLREHPEWLTDSKGKHPKPKKRNK